MAVQDVQCTEFCFAGAPFTALRQVPGTPDAVVHDIRKGNVASLTWRSALESHSDIMFPLAPVR